jgi:hypothetical protein
LEWQAGLSALPPVMGWALPSQLLLDPRWLQTLQKFAHQLRLKPIKQYPAATLTPLDRLKDQVSRKLDAEIKTLLRVGPSGGVDRKAELAAQLDSLAEAPRATTPLSAIPEAFMQSCLR